MRVYCSIGHSKGGLEAAVTGKGGSDLSTGGAFGFVGLFSMFASTCSLLSATKLLLFRVCGARGSINSGF